jgi:GntP family gluconate:H+ symporter
MNSNAALLLYAGLAVAGLIFLIVHLKVSAFIALTIASIFVGLVSGMEPADLLLAFQNGIGAVLGSIAIILGLGTILGKILAESGGAETISNRLIAVSGPNRLPWVFMLIGLIVGLPVFFSVGLVLLVPILFTTAIQHRIPLLRLALPMVAGLSAAHGFVPPHPGPLAAIELLNADLGRTILYSIPVALITAALAGPLFLKFFREKQLSAFGESPIKPTAQTSAKPSFALTLSIILLPILLMSATTIGDIFLAKSNNASSFLAIIGHPIVALLIGVLFASLTLGRSFNRETILKMSEDSLAPLAVIILVVGAGAGFSRVLIESGVGKAVAELATNWNLPAIPLGFALASLIRIATGSATVAITTCAGLIKPIADAQPGTDLELLVLAMGAGSLILSHVNDGGFWLVKGYLNLSVPQALRTWTVLETILALTGFACVLLLDLLLS